MLSANLINNIIYVKIACLLSVQIHLQDSHQCPLPSELPALSGNSGSRHRHDELLHAPLFCVS